MTWFKPSREETPPLIDDDYLERLRGHLGDDVVEELLADGQMELIDRAAQLDRLAADGDVEGMRRLSHDLIAVAGHLGLTALSLAAVELNRRLRSAAPERLPQLATQVSVLSAASLDAIANVRAATGS
ncbi:MAG: hypothetical protein AAF675_13455 [Pseudomonadota bacterium]